MAGSKKSIIFVLGGLSGGGAERVASHLINHWHETGREIILVIRRGPEEDFYPIPAGLKRYTLGGEGVSANKVVALFKNVPFVWRLRQAIKKEKAPIVISFLTKANIHTILACSGLRKKIIISERNDTTREQHPWPWPKLRNMLYKFADVVTANSKIALEGMKSYVPEDKLALVPNPVFIPNQKAKPDQSQILLNVGRLVPQKNQQLAIKAFSRIENEISKGWVFEIFGEGEEEDNLRKKAEELKVKERILLRGKVKEIEKYYLKSGIFILSSLYEGTPNALLEAMAFGVPPIVSDACPGALEFIRHGENGLIFSSGNEIDLSEKMKILMEDPEKRVEIGKNARETVNQFSLENVIPAWNRLIQNP